MSKSTRKSIKPHGELRQSQVLMTFGPGSMVDLPTRSVIISGLSYWRGQKHYIREERLAYKVLRAFRDQWPDLQEIKLATPPRQSNEPEAPMTGIDAFVFPVWFLAQVERTFEQNGKVYRTRPIVSWKSVKEGLTFEGKRVAPVPMRFVQGCTNGHLSDINWPAFAHSDFQSKCRGQIWLDEAGSGNDFEEIFVRCEQCGERRPLSLAKVPNSTVLGICEGHRPWLGSRGKQPCRKTKISAETGQWVQTDQPEYNRLLVRSASNAYFPQMLSVISIPDRDMELKQAVDRFYEEDLQYTEDLRDVEKELKKAKFADLVEFGAEVVWQEIERRKAGQGSSDKSIKRVELEALLSCPEQKGKETTLNDQVFQGYTRPPSSLDPKWSTIIDRVVLVHRLREVVSLIGFTRFEAAIPNIDGEIDDLQIGVRRAGLDFEPQWVPTIENLGEGVFISFKPEAISAWLKKPAVRAREKTLNKGYQKWVESRNISGDRGTFPGAAYVMLHSLSHLLITSVSLECGYASSAIRERIYAIPEVGYGILLHTGTAGSEGTLGGLVEVGRRIEHYLSQALEYGQLCSNDPVCAQHQPDNPQEDRFLHGAACHGCLLIAETSCERRNELLDRALVTRTVEGLGAEFFPEVLI